MRDGSPFSASRSRFEAESALSIPENTDTGNADGPFLFRLGVAFAAAYVLFLAVWFWGTRDGRSRVGGAARS